MLIYVILLEKRMSLPNKPEQLILDCEKAAEDFDKYKDHPLQVPGYNVFFINPPYNPENRRIIDPDNKKGRVIVYPEIKPYDWNMDDLGHIWEWSVDDCWAWLPVEKNGQKCLFHIIFTTLEAQEKALTLRKEYFNKLIRKNVNIYKLPHFETLLKSAKPDDPDYKKQYSKEISYLERQIVELKAGYLEKDDPEEKVPYGITACIPEQSLSSDVLVKWRPMLVQFAQSPLEKIQLTAGSVDLI